MYTVQATLPGRGILEIFAITSINYKHNNLLLSIKQVQSRALMNSIFPTEALLVQNILFLKVNIVVVVKFDSRVNLFVYINAKKG